MPASSLRTGTWVVRHLLALGPLVAAGLLTGTWAARRRSPPHRYLTVRLTCVAVHLHTGTYAVRLLLLFLSSTAFSISAALRLLSPFPERMVVEFVAECQLRLSAQAPGSFVTAGFHTGTWAARRRWSTHRHLGRSSPFASTQALGSFVVCSHAALVPGRRRSSPRRWVWPAASSDDGLSR